MNSLPFVISKKAVSDLEEIRLCTLEKWFLAQANHYYNLIFDEISYICKNSNAGKSMEHVRKAYRAAKVKSHLNLYRVLNDTIEVIKILHERMDIESRLSN